MRLKWKITSIGKNAIKTHWPIGFYYNRQRSAIFISIGSSQFKNDVSCVLKLKFKSIGKNPIKTHWPIGLQKKFGYF